jgi:hypothetical protein
MISFPPTFTFVNFLLQSYPLRELIYSVTKQIAVTFPIL